ncbi:MAG: protein YgfX [Halofilum sp. (in: g-proteobacteria)]|nr:protein YgfX [Halofilum sp. (in: g-proteobacteria)]
MSSPASAPGLRLEPLPSRRLRGLVAGLYAVALAGTLAALPPRWWPLLLAVGAALIGWDRRTHRPLGAIACDADGGWWLDGSGPYRLQPGTVVTPWLVVLVLRAGRSTRRVALLPDSLAAAAWRELRVHLRTSPIRG